MSNVTISIDADMLVKVKQHAAKRGISVNALVKQLLTKELGSDNPAWIESFFEMGDRLGLRSGDGRPLTREEIYDR